MRKTIRTGLRSILRPNFQHLLPVFREMAVTALFLRCQGLLLLNLYMNKPGKYLYFLVCMSSILSTNCIQYMNECSLPPVTRWQSFFSYAQGLFLESYSPRMALNTELTMLKNL